MTNSRDEIASLEKSLAREIMLFATAMKNGYVLNQKKADAILLRPPEPMSVGDMLRGANSFLATCQEILEQFHKEVDPFKQAILIDRLKDKIDDLHSVLVETSNEDTAPKAATFLKSIKIQMGEKSVPVSELINHLNQNIEKLATLHQSQNEAALTDPVVAKICLAIDAVKTTDNKHVKQQALDDIKQIYLNEDPKVHFEKITTILLEAYTYAKVNHASKLGDEFIRLLDTPAFQATRDATTGEAKPGPVEKLINQFKILTDENFWKTQGNPKSVADLRKVLDDPKLSNANKLKVILDKVSAKKMNFNLFAKKEDLKDELLGAIKDLDFPTLAKFQERIEKVRDKAQAPAQPKPR